MAINYTPKKGEQIYSIKVDGVWHDVVVLDTFKDGYVVIEALDGEPFMRGSMWGAFPSCQAVVHKRRIVRKGQ